MIDAESGDRLAEADMISVAMDLDAHAARELPSDIADAARAIMAGD